MDIITQSYAFSKVSIHPLFVQVRKKKNLAVQHNINKQTNKPDGGKKKKLQPIQPNPIQPNPTQPNPTQPSYQKDTTTLIVHIYLYLLWHREN